MADLICVAFDDPTAADTVLHEITTLQKEHLIELADACVVVRTEDGEVNLKQSMPLAKMGAIGGGTSGAMWGTLLGLLFVHPLAGLLVGASVGAASGFAAGKLTDYGINDDFIKNLGSTIKPNSSALFLLVKKVTADKVLKRMSHVRGHILQTSLSDEQEAKLREVLTNA